MGSRSRPAAVRRWRWGDEIAPLKALLGRGGILAIPTESSYGLAVDPLDERGVRAVFDLKRREGVKPLPLVIAAPRQLARLGVDWPSDATGGLERLWPAALSLLLPTARSVPAAAGGRSLAVRVPGHERLRRLLDRLGIAVTATSANLGGRPPILDPRDLDALLAGADATIVDDGVLAGGPPSTLVAVDGGVASVLRPGRVGVDTLRRTAPGLEVVAAGGLAGRGAPPVTGSRQPFSAASVEIPVEESS